MKRMSTQLKDRMFCHSDDLYNIKNSRKDCVVAQAVSVALFLLLVYLLSSNGGKRQRTTQSYVVTSFTPIPLFYVYPYANAHLQTLVLFPVQFVSISISLSLYSTTLYYHFRLFLPLLTYFLFHRRCLAVLCCC